jgi:hypothetical protein
MSDEGSDTRGTHTCSRGAQTHRRTERVAHLRRTTSKNIRHCTPVAQSMRSDPRTVRDGTRPGDMRIHEEKVYQQVRSS